MLYLHECSICIGAISARVLYLHWSYICMANLSAWVLYLHGYSSCMVAPHDWVLYLQIKRRAALSLHIFIIKVIEINENQSANVTYFIYTILS